MAIPIGEAIIFTAIVFTWAEGHAARRLFFSLAVAWLAGKALEGYTDLFMPWHWVFARLAVMLTFFFWAWRRARGWWLLIPFSLVLLSLVVIDLFFVNEPGVFAYDRWMFNGLVLLLALLAGGSYWEMAASVTAAMLVNQIVVPFFYAGVISHSDLPDPFTWNFWVCALSVFGLIGDNPVHRLVSLWKRRRQPEGPELESSPE